MKSLGRISCENTLMRDRPQVLFVCVHNAGRSQMAAALTTHHSAGSIDARSAGTEPADQVNPTVTRAMAELGIDVSQQKPKLLDDTTLAASDVVITMGCGDECPVYPGITYEDWELDDPSGQDLDTVRRIRDEVNARVAALVQSLFEEEGAAGGVARD